MTISSTPNANSTTNLGTITKEIRDEYRSKFGQDLLDSEVLKFKALYCLIAELRPNSSWAEKAQDIVKANPQLNHMQVSMVHVSCLELSEKGAHYGL